MPIPHQEKWEKEFKEVCIGDLRTSKETQEAVKSFIASTLSEYRKELVEKGEELKRMESDYDDEDKRSRRDVRPYNEGVDSVITLINK